MTQRGEGYDIGSNGASGLASALGRFNAPSWISKTKGNSAWMDGVLDGVMSSGGRIATITSVQDMMPGSKGDLIQVVIVENSRL